MAIKQGREYRALQDFSLVPRDEVSKEYRVRGTAIVFNSPTVLWECDGVEYKEIIDRHAFDECDMSDVIFNYNHGGKVVARLRNKTLALNIDERGVNIDADLGGTTAGRELYEEIDGGYVDKMSFSFTVREASYDSVTHTLTITKVKKAQNLLLHRNGHEPTVEEVAKELNMTPERIREIIRIAQDPVSLEAPVGEEEDSFLGDFIPDEDAPAPIDSAMQSVFKDELNKALDTLPARERDVLKFRYGIGSDRSHTLEEVGKEFNVTRERIRQIEAKALRKLRQQSRSKNLRIFLD